MAEVRLTKEGVKKYEDRLEYLKTTGRLEIAEQIKIARSFGDLSENAEYDAAKLEQSRMEYEIVELENMLKDVVLIESDAASKDVIVVGSKVRVHLSNINKTVEYQIMGSAESDPSQNRISNESPVGAALLNHKAGDVVDVNTPGGVMRIEIISIIK